jgi:hypothetical protein
MMRGGLEEARRLLGAERLRLPRLSSGELHPRRGIRRDQVATDGGSTKSIMPL